MKSQNKKQYLNFEILLERLEIFFVKILFNYESIWWSAWILHKWSDKSSETTVIFAASKTKSKTEKRFLQKLYLVNYFLKIATFVLQHLNCRPLNAEIG